VRNWIFVEDHARALYTVLTRGQVGETYNIGGHNEKRNIEVVTTICLLLEELAPSPFTPHAALIAHVADCSGSGHQRVAWRKPLSLARHFWPVAPAA